MYNKNLLFLFVLTFVGGACSSNREKQVEFLPISVNLEKNTINLSVLFDRVRPVFLETNDSSLIGARPKISFTDDKIFIRSANTIKIFDFNGMFLKSIDKIGRGDGEYLAISDFYINEKTEQIEILDKRRKKILYYNYEGEYLDELSFGFWAIKMIRDAQNRLYVYSGYEKNNDNKFKFNVFSNDKRLSFHEIDEAKSNYLHISNPVNFYEGNKKQILFFEPFNDTIYSLNESGIKPMYVISYQGYNIPNSFYENNKFSNVAEFFQEFKKHDYVNSTYNAIDTDNMLLFSCIRKDDKYLVLYDKANQTVSSYDKIEDDLFSNKMEMPFQDEEFLFFAKGNIAMFFIEPSQLIEKKEHIVSDSLNLIIQSLHEDDNSVLFIGHLK